MSVKKINGIEEKSEFDFFNSSYFSAGIKIMSSIGVWPYLSNRKRFIRATPVIIIYTVALSAQVTI